MSNISIHQFVDTSEAEKLFMPNGKIIVPKAEEAAALSQEELSVFCYKNGLYGLITDEVIEELLYEIDGKTAIEIGSGCGSLAEALGILATDNKEKESAFFQDAHAQVQQPIAEYGDNVEKLDAIEAIVKYKPEVVVGCWVTASTPTDGVSKQRIKIANRKAKGMGISIVMGIQSHLFYKLGVKKFILIGKEGIHGEALIDHQPYWDIAIIKSETFVSRTPEREKNAIWIYTRK